MSRRLRVYIAGPISRGDLVWNVNQATGAFVRLAQAGLAPFCPHWSVFSGGARRVPDHREGMPVNPLAGAVYALATVQGNPRMSHDDWLAVDLSWVAAADAVLRLPGESVGADREVWEAKLLGIPVFESVEQVVAWAAQPDPAAA